MFNFDPKINSENNDILLEVVNDLQQIINYINENIIIKKKVEEINLEEKIEDEENIFSDFNGDDKKEKKLKKENKINLGKKRKKSISSKEKIYTYNEREKVNIKDFQKHFIEIITRIKDLIIKINNNKEYINKLNQSKISTINNKNYQELELDDGKYFGEIVNGKKEGKGIICFNNGNRYEGEFKNDKYNGRGIYYWNNGNMYKGDFINGKKEGKGKYYFKNGDIYEGDFKNDKFNGKGIDYHNEGDRYEGDFRKGKYDGKGVIYFINGDREMGDFSNDKAIGKLVVLNKNGEVSELCF